MSIGKSINRVDAFDKVTGRAQFTDDFKLNNALVAKILHSTIASGVVKVIDISEAMKLKGVVKIVTCFDVPDIQYPTAGHPYSLDPAHMDIADRKLLNKIVRYYGDDIAAVVATDSVTATRAINLIKVEYEEYEPILSIEAALKQGANKIHEEYPGNILAHTSYEIGNYENAIKEEGLIVFEGEYELSPVKHCHIENPISYAYAEGKRLVVVSSTQIPHIARRVIGQALGIDWGKIRVIKPYIGGGFGNKQEVLYEPLNAYLCKVIGGRCVKLDISREEDFVNTRLRTAMKIKIKSYVRANGRFVARKLEMYGNKGAYASHGHSVTNKSGHAFKQIYKDEVATKGDMYSVYTNMPASGAMRGYGIPQITFALESHVDDIASKLGLDKIEMRKLNAMKLGFIDNQVKCNSNGLAECIEKGRKYIDWDNKLIEYKNQTGTVRRGVGMAIFSYAVGVFPISLETAACRIVLNQDGSVQVQMGATEIGQGADTVFAQMVSEVLDIPIENVHTISTQDTDITPFDTGAYASRQSYVSGMAAKKAAMELKEKIIEHANFMLRLPAGNLELKDNNIIKKETGEVLASLKDVSMHALYNTEKSVHITSEVTNQCKSNTFAFGVCFAEVEVDIPVGKIKVIKVINVHDSGTILNPALAAAQVHGGMSMSLGYGLTEQLLFDDATGRMLNDNLLDYKLPTTMDTPHLEAQFVETYDVSGPFGNKALGEPPAIPVAPAIRNAVLNATGVNFNIAPLTPQRLVEKFKKENLI
ncbi:xanthine dehydrogenase molybdenum-binding subunit XdhA [Clostridium sp. FP2]|uniref:xanthine dehydrogenase subunit XdhA n=1 Tax=Clostridium TaxID=1485 RepID=UPI0013E95BF8|nr:MULTISPECIES: xanthine dehydrogenase subunit XdhA [Clostridium]MBW9156795.1 xanthine dehydrogenase molybdenum-binding subunit XdhA [Clostridium tagluense]MBZ9621966.1 xanthine dehydrogenase molybdenum-binding subunit XdhA [Clostridium sp. FP2]WLC66277.1 xanthine dehydrogenase molybdenum-binding subunit XdhA [Clostridium tagluense]